MITALSYAIPIGFMVGLGYLFPEYGIYIGCAICLIIGVIYEKKTGGKIF